MSKLLEAIKSRKPSEVTEIVVESLREKALVAIQEARFEILESYGFSRLEEEEDEKEKGKKETKDDDDSSEEDEGEE